MIEVSHRTELLARGAREWRDANSHVRVEARHALGESHWSPHVVEAARDNVLWDLDEGRATDLAGRIGAHAHKLLDERPVLVILPGNVIGPAIASAYCAALVGARAIFKSAGNERRLAEVVARQFERIGPPLAGTIEARYWKGGDRAIESDLFRCIGGIVAFGSDEVIGDIRKRAPGVNEVGL